MNQEGTCEGFHTNGAITAAQRNDTTLTKSLGQLPIQCFTVMGVKKRTMAMSFISEQKNALCCHKPQFVCAGAYAFSQTVWYA